MRLPGGGGMGEKAEEAVTVHEHDENLRNGRFVAYARGRKTRGGEGESYYST